MKIWEIMQKENIGKVYKTNEESDGHFKLKSIEFSKYLQLTNIYTDKNIDDIFVVNAILDMDFEEFVEKKKVNISLADKMLLDIYHSGCNGECISCVVGKVMCDNLEEYLDEKGYFNKNIELVEE